jgi:hypothetical protein
MKKFYYLILALILSGDLFFPVACGKNISPTSSTSSSGTVTGTATVSATPTATVNTSSFYSAYQNSVFPSSTYAGESDAWVGGTSPGTVNGSSPYLEISTVASPGLANPHGYARSLVEFTGINLPSNVTILGAEVWLTTETATNVSGSVTVGVHTFALSVYDPAGSSCMVAWTPSNVSWNGVNGTNWSTCDGSAGVLNSNSAMFNSTPNSTVVFSNANNGISGIYRFLLNASDVQTEISSGTIQFVLRSEGEFQSDTGTSLIGFYPNTDTTGKAPKLLISYQ